MNIHLRNTKTKPGSLIAACVRVTLIIGASMLLGGCSTTSMERSENVGTSMTDVKNDINKAIAQLDVTNASLQDLIKPGQSNAKKAFEKYADDVEKMEKVGQRMLKHTDKMHEQGKEYFDEWRTEGNAYRNPEIQALSEQRRSDLTAIFAEISGASVGVKGAFKSYMSDIREIQTYLSNDLTAKGIESISPVADKAIADGAYLKAAVDPVLIAIDSANAELAHGGAK